MSPILVHQMYRESEFSRPNMSICLGPILSTSLQSVRLAERAQKSSVLAMSNMQTLSERLKRNVFLKRS